MAIYCLRAAGTRQLAAVEPLTTHATSKLFRLSQRAATLGLGCSRQRHVPSDQLISNWPRTNKQQQQQSTSAFGPNLRGSRPACKFEIDARFEASHS